jgi:hypothetical protein
MREGHYLATFQPNLSTGGFITEDSHFSEKLKPEYDEEHAVYNPTNIVESMSSDALGSFRLQPFL